MKKAKKSKPGKAQPIASEPVREQETIAVEQPFVTKPASGDSLPDRLWLPSAVFITALATFLRFYWLELKPFHHDEGVNGWFLRTLFKEGVYKYDPANYHGPTLYYISLA